MQPKFFACINDLLCPYYRAIVLVSDVRVMTSKDKVSGFWMCMGGESGGLNFYRPISFEALKIYAELECELEEARNAESRG